MKYLGINGGHLIESFVITPTFDVSWMTLKDRKTYWDVRFCWFFWYVTVGQIKKKLKEQGYY